MKRQPSFRSGESGRITGGILVCLVVVGLFATAVDTMRQGQIGQDTVLRTSPTAEISGPRWLRDVSGGTTLPQIGPLTDRR